MVRRARWLSIVSLAWLGMAAAANCQMPLEEAWQQLPHYAYGQDMAPLLAVERAVIDAMAVPGARGNCGAVGSVAHAARRDAGCTAVRLPATAADRHGRGDPAAGSPAANSRD